jgi:hypothetical protein
MLVLDMIEILPPLRKYKYDTWRILAVKCYIDSSVRLRSCIRNVNTPTDDVVGVEVVVDLIADTAALVIMELVSV